MNPESGMEGLAHLLGEVEQLVVALRVAPLREEDRAIANRLERSVVRPLRNVTASVGATQANAAPLAAHLADLARTATALRTPSVELLEATAALQDLAIGLDPGQATALGQLQKELAPSLQSAADGPYLVTNVFALRNWLGEDLPVRPQMALCRCGASKSRPLCDGTHADIGFTAKKDPARQPDRRDVHAGMQITVLDNRGLCGHSGYCTDRVPGAFHATTEPFATPNGARLDEVIRATRNCPSGALSLAVHGHEAREAVDTPREPTIEVSKDGPYRITGQIALLDAEGGDERRNIGASREHYSLCRCGRSQNKPFCSGMHWTVHFSDPPPPKDPNLFQWMGGTPALLAMTRIFYSKYVPQDPLLSGLFSTMSPDHPERVAAWLAETFGGPKTYSTNYGGYNRMVAQHKGKSLTEEMRARWAELLYRSANDAGLPNDPEFRAAFAAYIEWGSRLAVENSTPGAKPPPNLPVPRWWWVCEARPGSRVSALAPSEEVEVEPPAAGERPSFAKHVKGLFRALDRNSMKFVFDLWERGDVLKHGEAILHRLEAGTMPCDGAWSKERVDVFRRWLTSGGPE